MIKLQTDPAVVARLAEERADENWRFRSFLKGHLSAAELDAIVHRHHETVARQIDCTTCGNCCREVRPTLGDQDVTRLAAGLGVSREELTERFLATQETGDLTFNKMPCPLLSGNCCTAYAHRPADCRSYPHLQKDEFRFRLIQAVQNCSICPIVFNVVERLRDELWHSPHDVWPMEGD